MHELGICDALLKMVDKAVKEEGCEGVSSITGGYALGRYPAFSQRLLGGRH